MNGWQKYDSLHVIACKWKTYEAPSRCDRTMIIEIMRTIYACAVTLAASEPREGKLKIPRPILISNRTRNERIDRHSNSPITPQTSGYVGPVTTSRYGFTAFRDGFFRHFRFVANPVSSAIVWTTFFKIFSVQFSIESVRRTPGYGAEFEFE